MPKINIKEAEEHRRKQVLIMKIKAEKGMYDLTEEQTAAKYFGLGRAAYRRRMEKPGEFTINELFRMAEALKVPMPELLGYKLDTLEKVII